ncbi:type VI secretion system Vgr family protein [Andreprevotia chitinilytica]|uniref:type VI secretion system Vgr family protein n=1 Tax=Andreprevotia chitinilytica TaxID=396808 RepID=UPI00068EEFB7|nr:type VI secretion system tip protein TssI/VgrG [Andreprevotia chitinilytica]
MSRIVKAHTPLGDALQFRAMNGTEALSELFEFEVELLSESHSLDLKALLGKSLTLEIETGDGGQRYLDGIVARCVLVGREDDVARLYRYRATVRPWLWLLTRTQDCKIFQNQTVPQILQTVLGEYGFAVEQSLTGSYRQWGYCVQYQETDFAFVSRLMEHEGIYYYFKHAQGSHTLVLADDIGTHAVFPGYDSVPFFAADRAVTAQEECIDVYQVAEEIAPGSYVTDDYNFTKPRAKLQNQRSNPAAHDHSQYEIYDWLGGYSDHGESDHYSRIRLEELQAERQRDEGHATARGLAPGYRFTLRNCPRLEANREYLVVSTTYRLREPGYASSVETAYYEFDFVTQPTSLPYRPQRVTPKPRTNGPQTAVVVGPPGEEIWTDQYGRIKVQFRWDRYGLMDENSSCWVRVASGWAGSSFGGIHIPRVGQEVIVDFIAGEPDRPIVMGSTYNADQMPPFGLPASATQSGFVSRSVKGSPANANAIRFEDQPGGEQLWLHAEKDHLVTVENDATHTVGVNYSKTVGLNYSKSVGGNSFVAVQQNHTQQVQGDQTEVVQGYLDKTVHGYYKETVDKHHTFYVGEGEENTVKGTQVEQVEGPYTGTYEKLYTFNGQNDVIHNVLNNTVTFNNKKEEHKTDTDFLVHGKSSVGIDSADGGVSIKAKTNIDVTSDTGDITITATSGDIKVTSPQKITISAPKVSAKSTNMDYTFTPVKLEVVEIFKNSWVTLSAAGYGKALSLYVQKTDMYAFKKDLGLFKFTDTTLDSKNKLIELEKKGGWISNSVFHVML